MELVLSKTERRIHHGAMELMTSQVEKN
uniref:Uncharacterized protein n=1 Tax=Anguilla anguilla TaxID=7936 RepID=A0A0E9UHQ4_ANGAN